MNGTVIIFFYPKSNCNCLYVSDYSVKLFGRAIMSQIGMITRSGLPSYAYPGMITKSGLPSHDYPGSTKRIEIPNELVKPLSLFLFFTFLEQNGLYKN